MYLNNILVLIADGTPDTTHERILASGITLDDDRVPVRKNYGYDIGDVLGHATLRKDGDRIYADLVLYDLPDIPQNELVVMRPGVGGVIIEREGNVVTKCRLTHIGLFTAQNADRRIGTLSEQFFGARAAGQPPVLVEGMCHAVSISGTTLRPSFWQRVRNWFSRGTLREV